MRLNGESRARDLDRRIAEVLSPKEIRVRDRLIQKGKTYTKSLLFDGNDIVLDLHFIKRETESYFNRQKNKNRHQYFINEENTPVWVNKIQKNGNPRTGRNFKPEYVEEFKDRWDFIKALIE